MRRANQLTLYWTWVQADEWKFIIAATTKGLCFVGSPNMVYEDLSAWAARQARQVELIEDAGMCQSYASRMIAYLNGERPSFAIPMDVRGTPFQLEVWEALQMIPYGQTRTYSDIASQIGKPSAARAAGAAIGANPLLIAIPCHRVIAKDGSLTGYRGGLEMKEKLLQLEASSTNDDGDGLE